MELSKLLELVIAQNEIIIQQNEKMLLLLAARVNQKNQESPRKLKEFRKSFEQEIPR